jgi:hypothetical protein
MVAKSLRSFSCIKVGVDLSASMNFWTERVACINVFEYIVLIYHCLKAWLYVIFNTCILGSILLTLVAFVSSSCGLNMRHHFLLELSAFSLLSFFSIYFLLIHYT